MWAASGYVEGDRDDCRSKSHTGGAGGTVAGKENLKKSLCGSLPVRPAGALTMVWTGVSRRL